MAASNVTAAFRHLAAGKPVMGGSALGLCSIDSIAFVRGCVETNEGGNKSCPEGLCLFVSWNEKEQIVRAIGC